MLVLSEKMQSVICLCCPRRVKQASNMIRQYFFVGIFSISNGYEQVSEQHVCMINKCTHLLYGVVNRTVAMFNSAAKIA